jgi:single-strand DNA-binding protein
MSTPVQLVGRLGKDPELRFTKSGKAVVSFSLATSKSVKDENGKYSDSETTWWEITAWEEAAQNIADTLKKGDPVVVLGRGFMDKFQDKSGVERQSMKVVAYNVALDLSKRSAVVNRDGKVAAPVRVERDPWDADSVQDAMSPF